MKYIGNKLQKLKNFIIEQFDKYKNINCEISNTTILKSQQFIYVVLGIIIVLIIVMTIVYGRFPYSSKIDAKKTFDIVGKKQSDHYQLKLATDSVKAEQKWQNYLEDKIEEEQKLRDEQLKLLENSVAQKEESIKNTQNTEFQEIKSRLAFLLSELEQLRTENNIIKNDLLLTTTTEENADLRELNVTNIKYNEEISLADSNYDYIPATSYVTGKLLGGIAVSTAISSSANPIPVIIRLEDRGNLPKDFAVDISQCRILGSCYGDISSERAIIRAEELICEDKVEGLVITTRVAGVIYGDDGMNGIRGSVVSMSEKHLRNAFTSGVLSGFANIAQGQEGYNITSLGSITTKKKNMGDVVKGGALTGMTTAAEKLADYHIKLAENISPVILIPGGTKVDVMFTKGVHIGSRNIKEKLEAARGKNG
jgi:conjugal transfer pilus assembly protein TraB